MVQAVRALILTIKRLLVISPVLLLTAVACRADAVLTDSTFNPANYTLTPGFTTAGTSMTISQCGNCGDPSGPGLEFDASFGDTTTAEGLADLGIINNNFVYNPQTEGPIGSISASVDKDLNINITSTGAPFGNTFRPMIEQDGNFYAAAIAGPSLSGGNTGYQSISQSGLTAADFIQFNFNTGTFGTANPNFAGDPMMFGIAQMSAVGGFPSANITAVYDNLTLDVQTAPEPSTLWLSGGAGLLLLGFARMRARRN